MALQTYLLPVLGVILVACFVSETEIRLSSVIGLISLSGIILLGLGTGDNWSIPTVSSSPRAEPQTTGHLPGAQKLPDPQPRANKRPGRRYQTYRISNIPICVSQDGFRKALVDTESEDNLIGFSWALAVASSLPAKYYVATATFIEAPEVGDLQKSLRIRFGRPASLLKVDFDFFGLTPVYSPPDASEVNVDIIAVVGLAGHGFGTWKAKGKPSMWLRDFLPGTVPNTRIMTYGYDTALPGSQSEKSVVDLSRHLLESIKTSRDETFKYRPLILIGHSLGGLVVKQALVQASEGSEEDKAVFNSCFAILLFGVPNRGMDNGSLIAMVKGQPNEAIVRDLSPSSRFLSEMHRQFSKVFTFDDSTIISWYETKETATIEYSEVTGSFERTNKFRMLVGHTSATHAGPKEKNYDQIVTDADHSNIVKFDYPSNPDYLVVAGRVRGQVILGPEILKKRLAERRRHLTKKEKEYIRLLHAPDYAAFRKYKIPDPAPNTLGWFLNKPEFVTWKDGEESSILWLQGSAGQGKTILAKFLVSHLEDAVVKARSEGEVVIYFFFYEQDDALRTVGSILRALIRQLLSLRDVETFGAISEKVDLDGSHVDEVGLWDVLERLLKSPVLNKVFCVIDALDEFPDKKLRGELMTFFSKLTASSESKTSRPS